MKKRPKATVPEDEINHNPTPPGGARPILFPEMYASPFDDGGVSIIKSFQDDPLILLDHCRKWLNQAVWCDFLSSLVDTSGLQTLCHRVLDHHRLFLQNTTALVLWSDVVLKSVDPQGLLSVFEYYLKTLFAPAADFLEENPQHTRETEDAISKSTKLDLKSEPQPRPEGQTIRGADWGNAWAALIRIKTVADFDYHRKLAEQDAPDEADLITAAEIAKIVHLGRRSIEPYRSDWPEPDVPGRGSRPDKWNYVKLREHLMQQFKIKDLPYRLPHRSPT